LREDGSTYLREDGYTYLREDESTYLREDGSTYLGEDGSTYLGEDGSTHLREDGSTYLREVGSNIPTWERMNPGLRPYRSCSISSILSFSPPEQKSEQKLSLSFTLQNKII
jgi:hypothetical protein